MGTQLSSNVIRDNITQIKLIENQYVLDKISDFQKILIEHNRILIKGGTGIGKSSSLYRGNENIISVLNSNISNSKRLTVVVVPTNLKLEIDHKEFDVQIINKQNKIVLNNLDKISTTERVVATNYSNLSKVIQECETNQIRFNIIFDEAHNLYEHCKQNFKLPNYEFIDDALVTSKYLKKVVYMSATFERAYVPHDYHIIEFKKVNDLKVDVEVALYDKSYLKLLIEKLLLRINDGISIVFYNDKKELKTLKESLYQKLKNIGVAIEKEDIIIISRDTKKSKEYERIINCKSDEESFAKNVKVVLCTSIIEDAISLYTNRPNQYIQILKDESRINTSVTKQFVGRIRNNTKATLFLFMSFDKKRFSKNYDQFRYSQTHDAKEIELFMQNRFSSNLHDIERQYKSSLTYCDNYYSDLIKSTRIEKHENLRLAMNDQREKIRKPSLTQWKAAYKTQEELRQREIGYRNILEEFKRQFGDEVTITRRKAKRHLHDDITDYDVNEMGMVNMLYDRHYFRNSKYNIHIETLSEKGNIKENFEVSKCMTIFNQDLSKLLYELYTNNADDLIRHVIDKSDYEIIEQMIPKSSSKVSIQSMIQNWIDDYDREVAFNDLKNGEYFRMVKNVIDTNDVMLTYFNRFLERFEDLKQILFTRKFDNDKLIDLIFSTSKDGVVNFYDNKHFFNHIHKINIKLYAKLLNDDDFKNYNQKRVYDSIPFLNKCLSRDANVKGLINAIDYDKAYVHDDLIGLHDQFISKDGNDKQKVRLIKMLFDFNRVSKQKHIKFLKVMNLESERLKGINYELIKKHIKHKATKV